MIFHQCLFLSLSLSLGPVTAEEIKLKQKKKNKNFLWQIYNILINHEIRCKSASIYVLWGFQSFNCRNYKPQDNVMLN